MSGISIRTDRLFDRESGRSFMVAIDRTVSVGPEPFAGDAGALIASIVDGGADAILMSLGLIKQFGSLAAFRGGPALVARADFPFMYGVTQGEGEEFRMIATAEEAVALGADAVVMFLTGATHERRVFGDNAAAVAAMAAECRRLGVPLIVEAVPWGAATPDMRDPKLVAELSRVAAELGADIVKTENVGSAEAMEHVVRSCPVPVLLLGGPMEPLPQLLDKTATALDSGARGVVFGRNAWQRDDSADAMSSLRSLVHGRPRA
ncbi:class I fructose-bisphosphate aldolase [Demequina sp.]|uniref:class I fructose-bisphosphate aldolase n=1 Tax=Demequina sp. TaxID=2050685 RepID=UPI003A89245E